MGLLQQILWLDISSRFSAGGNRTRCDRIAQVRVYTYGRPYPEGNSTILLRA
ncbi:MAG: hypothetical protein AAFQ41_07485 [Cyanobacteria bacterium J06623_7]